MGTPRVSASLDQIRNAQKSAKRGGECTVGCAVETRVASNGAASTGASSSRSAGAIIATDCCDGAVAVAGCTGFCCDRRHDFIVAQHSHCTIGVGMLMPHTGAGACDDIAASATASKAPT
jgi:hypothetical protein